MQVGALDVRVDERDDAAQGGRRGQGRVAAQRGDGDGERVEVLFGLDEGGGGGDDFGGGA